MKLLIKQMVFSWTDTYDIYDENGEAKYFVKSEFLSIGHKIHVYDRYDREVGMVREKLLKLLPTLEIDVDVETVGTVKKEVDFSPAEVRDRLQWLAVRWYDLGLGLRCDIGW